MDCSAGPLTVSVVIPVWNDPDGLQSCLSALKNQTLASTNFEIIVVDNGSVPPVTGLPPGVRLLVEAQPGSYTARNCGLNVASGEFVAFIDADCIPEPDWLEQLLVVANQPGSALVAGRVVLSAEESPRSQQTTADLYERLFGFDQQQNAANGESVTANWLSPRSLMLRFGGFDTRLMSGADIVLSRRLSSAGYKVVHAASAVVVHPTRSTFRALARKRRRVVGGRWAARSARLTSLPGWAPRLGGQGRRVLLRPDLTLAQRFRLTALIIGLAAVEWKELLRLSFGGRPRRA